MTRGQAALTFFSCGGCGATAVFAQRERQYGRLVHGFFDQHERCGDAVEISAAHFPAPAPLPGTSQVPGAAAPPRGPSPATPAVA